MCILEFLKYIVCFRVHIHISGYINKLIYIYIYRYPLGCIGNIKSCMSLYVEDQILSRRLQILYAECAEKCVSSDSLELE